MASETKPLKVLISVGSKGSPQQEAFVKEIRSFDTTGYETHIGGEIATFVTDPAGPDRAFQLLDTALAEALNDLPAGLLEEADERRGTGVVLGTCQGAILSGAALHRRYLQATGQIEAGDVDRFQAYEPGCGARRVAE